MCDLATEIIEHQSHCGEQRTRYELPDTESKYRYAELYEWIISSTSIFSKWLVRAYTFFSEAGLLFDLTFTNVFLIL